mgnify:CR=1 FL=1
MPALCDREVWVLEKLVLARWQKHVGYADYATLNAFALDKCFEYYPYEDSLRFLIELGLIEIDEGYLTNGLRFRITADGFMAINEATENNQKRLNDNTNAALTMTFAFMSMGIGLTIAGASANMNAALQDFMLDVGGGLLLGAGVITAVVQGVLFTRSRQNRMERYDLCQWEKNLPSVNKYDSLWEHLRVDGHDAGSMSFREIKDILGFRVGFSFSNYKKEAPVYGYQVGKVSWVRRTIEFSKVNQESNENETGSTD